MADLPFIKDSIGGYVKLSELPPAYGSTLNHVAVLSWGERGEPVRVRAWPHGAPVPFDCTAAELDAWVAMTDAMTPKGASGPCNLGVGCDQAGVCYASQMGTPDKCGRT